jgi:hypothetical protein
VTPHPNNAADIPLHQDTTCRRCGYNLRGLLEDGHCPECGAPIKFSVRGDQLQFCDPLWLQRVRRGLKLMLWYVVVLVMSVVIVLTTSCGGNHPGAWRQRICRGLCLHGRGGVGARDNRVDFLFYFVDTARRESGGGGRRGAVVLGVGRLAVEGQTIAGVSWRSEDGSKTEDLLAQRRRAAEREDSRDLNLFLLSAAQRLCARKVFF